MLIAFGYKAESGKDTASTYLKDKYGFKVLAFAENLKEFCFEHLGLSKEQLYTQEGKATKLSTPIVYDERVHGKLILWMRSYSPTTILDDGGGALLGHVMNSPRDVVQFIGTDAMRKYNPNYHLECCFDRLVPGYDYVISDARFQNEVEGVIEKGGLCVELTRDSSIPGGQKNTMHASEISLSGWRGWFSRVNNTGSIEDFHYRLDLLMEEIHKWYSMEATT